MAQARPAIAPKTKLSKNEMRQRAQARRQLDSRLTWGAIGLVAVAGLSYAVWQAFRPKPGAQVAQLARTHIQLGDPHEPYNSDPPISGSHAAPVDAGF